MDKALRPDGYTNEFLLSYWGINKKDFCDAFDKFYDMNERGFCRSFLAKPSVPATICALLVWTIQNICTRIV